MKYIIIPDEVFSSDIKDGPQRLYGLLYAMYRKNKKPVRADNKWLAKRMNKTERQVRRYLSNLKKHNTIFIQFERFSSTSVKRLIIPLLCSDQKCPVDTKRNKYR